MNKFNTIQPWKLIMKKGNILENPENAGEYGRRIQNVCDRACGRACGRETALVIEMRETTRDAGDLVGLQ